LLGFMSIHMFIQRYEMQSVWLIVLDEN
jgi:hypothetical protein